MSKQVLGPARSALHRDQVVVAREQRRVGHPGRTLRTYGGLAKLIEARHAFHVLHDVESPQPRPQWRLRGTGHANRPAPAMLVSA